MGNIEELHLNEDLSKPENRVNLALFSLMQQDWFRDWVLGKLDLDVGAVVYPPRYVKGVRPDLKVVHNGSQLAMIEVELGRNQAQADVYRDRFGTVKTIWGRRGSGGDLSLEEIAEFLREPRCLPAQTRINVQHLSKLIEEGLRGHSPPSDRSMVSPEMWEHSLVKALRDRLGDRLDATTGPVRVGHFKADTIGQEGFSLSVNRRDVSGSVALVSIRSGVLLIFPSRSKLNRCLPGRPAEVNSYISLITTMGCDVDSDVDNARPGLSLDANLDAVLGRIDELARCLEALAG